MKKKKMIKFRLIILMVLCAGLLLGAWIVRGHLIHEPFRTNVRQAFQAPCREYIFGTDNLGRCVACRILYGASTSLYAAVLAVLAVFIIGTAVGVTAAYAGGIVDRILMKITLVFQAFPLERKLSRFLTAAMRVYKVPEAEQAKVLAFIQSLDIKAIATEVMYKLFAMLEMKYDFKLSKNGEMEETR